MAVELLIIYSLLRSWPSIRCSPTTALSSIQVHAIAVNLPSVAALWCIAAEHVERAAVFVAIPGFAIEQRPAHDVAAERPDQYFLVSHGPFANVVISRQTMERKRILATAVLDRDGILLVV